MLNTFSKIKLTALLACFIFLSMCSYSKADLKNEDVEIYHKFFKVIGAESQYNQMLIIMVNQFQQGFASGLKRVIEKSENATAEDKEKVRRLFTEAMNNYLQRLKAKISETMPFDMLVDNIYIPVYSKYFNIEEIKEVIAFFEKPVGRKFVSVTPNLMQESVAKLNRKYGLKLQEIGKTLAEEEFVKIKPELNKLKRK